MELARRKPRSHHPTSRVVLGQRARFWPKCISHWSRGNTGITPGLHQGPHQWGAIRPEDASVAIQAQPGRPGKNGSTPFAHAHTHAHTQTMPNSKASILIICSLEWFVRGGVSPSDAVCCGSLRGGRREENRSFWQCCSEPLPHIRSCETVCQSLACQSGLIRTCNSWFRC